MKRFDDLIFEVDPLHFEKLIEMKGLPRNCLQAATVKYNTLKLGHQLNLKENIVLFFGPINRIQILKFVIYGGLKEDLNR